MLEFPLHESFFPQVVLNAEEVRYYKRLGKERLSELIRIAEDAELAYKWSDVRASKTGTTIQKTQFLDMRPATKATFASTLIKCSVVIPDTHPDEVLLAISRAKTKEYRKMMAYLHGGAFMDGRTLFKFPSSIAASRPEYSYRAIKWCAFKGKSESNKLDFSFLEYAGKKKPAPGSMVVGFCLQESIQRDREIPLLEDFGFVRGYLSRSGIIVSKTHQPNVVRVTSICQIDGDIEQTVRNVLEGIMQDMVGSVVRLRGLLDRQRVSGMKFLEQWEWVANSDRKACAVCLKGFFFHRKHHCRACGEVVCSSCAPLRELDEPIYDIKELRICTSCMTKAGRRALPEITNDRNNQNETLTSDESAQSHNADSRGRRNTTVEDRQYIENETRDRLHRPSDAARMLLDDNNKGTPKSKRRLRSFLKNPRENMATLTHLVDQIRTTRNTINLTISETGESRLSFGEEDAYSELYDRVDKLRSTVEHSVDGRSGDPRTRKTSTASSRNPSFAAPVSRSTLHNDHPVDPYESNRDDLEYRISEDSIQDDFDSVVEMTFAAAKATRAVGNAVLSSQASDHNGHSDTEEVEDVLRSPSEASGYSSDPYSAVNYERAMAGMGPAARGTFYDDGYSNTSDSFKSNHNPMRSSRVRDLEQKIQALQRDLREANRKLSFFETEEPDPEYSSLGTLHEQPLGPERSRRMSNVPSQARRQSDVSRLRNEAPTRYAPAKRRPSSEGLTRPTRKSIDVGTLNRRSTEPRRRGSEFAPRPSAPNLTSRASTGTRAHSTAEMLTELYNVMNSSEITKPSLPARKSSMFARMPSPPESQRGFSRSSSPRAPSVATSTRSRPPPPPPPSMARMVYIDDKGRELARTSSTLEESPKGGNGLDKTASSSASYAQYLGDSRSSNGSARLASSAGPKTTDSGLSSNQYRDLMAGRNPAHEDETSSDDDDIYGEHHPSNQELHDEDDDDGHEEPQRRESGFFGDIHNTDRVFFGSRAVPTVRTPQFPSARRGSVLGVPPRPSAGQPSGRDESEELRDLMEGLAGRPRSSSVPFRPKHGSSHDEETYERPTWSDGASVRRQLSPYRREPSFNERYDRPPSSRQSSTRSRAQSSVGQSTASLKRSPQQIQGAVLQVRECLASLHTECPSQWERHRKLQSISKILKSLQREGVRSKFRSLSHEEFQYERVLEETPSIVNLLRLAGYVSQPQKLVMRNVDQDYLGVLLQEIENELHDMQATQDYL